ncbi:hypothetical protein BDR03DRAFT_934278 [Suillus americanus]|nr:hypothetical protein BDR03DRAFT_934278 [Suillus americanus]
MAMQAYCKAESHPETPSHSLIREKLHKQFGKRACLWQLKVAEVFLKKAGDVVCIAGTGMGKTLAFWSPLALTDTGVQIVITPLNQLGHQSDIEDMCYHAIITSPEQLVKAGGEFEKLLWKPTFASQIIGFVFDKAHCITSWGEFRTEYKELECLQYILPCYVPFMIASATLMPNTL